MTSRAPIAGLARLLPGLVPVVIITALAYVAGKAVPILGGPILAILGGLTLGQFAGQRASWKPGVTFAAKRILQTSIVLLGAGLSLAQLARIGAETLPILLGTLVIALVAGHLIGRWLKVEGGIRSLITYGTTICGASAIATMSAVIGSNATQIAFAIAVIVVYNVLGAVLFPLLGHAMGMSQESFGLWAGTAINDTSSVVAAATVYGAAAASYAVVVKLTRTLAIIPMAVVEAARTRRREPQAGPAKPWYRLVPTFLVLFVLAAAINSTGIIPHSWAGPIHEAAIIGTTAAMAGVGLSSSFNQLRAAGWRPVALGGLLWVVLALSSLGLQALTGRL